MPTLQGRGAIANGVQSKQRFGDVVPRRKAAARFAIHLMEWSLFARSLFATRVYRCHAIQKGYSIWIRAVFFKLTSGRSRRRGRSGRSPCGPAQAAGRWSSAASTAGA